MKSAVYSAYGGPEVLTLQETPKPTPTATQVLIKVAAAGINPVATKLRMGYIKMWPQTLPIIPGWDAAGTVEAVGASVTDFAVGDEVYSYNRPAWDMADERPECAPDKIGMNGCCAEYTVAEAWKVAKKPKSYSMAQAGSVPLVALTAFQGIFEHGGLADGQVLLILNASGGVGSWAVNLAKAKLDGVTVLGVCSARSAKYVTSIGADVIIDYTLKASVAEQCAAWCAKSGKSIDLCFDCIGGDSTAQGVEALKDGGKIIAIANLGPHVTDAAAAKTKGSCTGRPFFVQPSSVQLTEIAALVDAGKITPTKLTEMRFAEVAAAHAASETKRTHGKVVLVM